MIYFIARRCIEGIVVILVVTLIAFVMFRFLGDPVSQMLGMDATAADREFVRDQLGLNDPVLIQYMDFALRVLQGDFGISYQFKRPVIELIAESFPATFELVIGSTIVALIVGTTMGIYTALYRDSALTRLLLLLSVFGVAVPTFLISIAGIYIFSVNLGWLPSYGRGEVVSIGGWTTGLLTSSGRKALVLPTMTLAVFQLALVMRLVRAEMSEILLSDHIRFARARGTRPFPLYFIYAFRNALIPVVTVVGMQIGSLMGFSVVTELIFQWPGVGLLFLQSIQSIDVPVLSAYMLVVCIMIVAVNFLTDTLYAVIDPRIVNQ